MILLIVYVSVALGFSFLCSIAEAVILSVTMAHVAVVEQEEKPYGPLLRKLKGDINKPLAAILTLNTIAHTVGAAGAGAQAAVVFGTAWVGVASAVLTLMILIFSEIIPKTLGAHYWRRLAPATAYGLKFLVWFLHPFVWMSEKLTNGLSHGKTVEGLTREEFAVMAELGEKEGQLDEQESTILKNLFLLRETRITDIMTPRPVVFSLPESLGVEAFFASYANSRFSRVPVYSGHQEHVTGFVLRNDIILAYARGNTENNLITYRRELPTLPDKASVYDAFETLLRKRAHLMLIVDEYGGMEGIVSLEDVVETLIGLEILDEGDRSADMQQLARRLWRKRATEMGLQLEDVE
ncbi:CNNM domain-containing protein [Solemya velesiana gill symbiont]|uniref:Hemolysin n=1 Tax=Solemya velesiana gill symbiont TaxID=1918948 RepID=A0A1T2KYD5_9GAMM|nr:hemolysin family protein [Solemya velesiana gill symbiont]OOZ37843.1 hemolysin [Solemya velesiana gill symbiont]